MSKTAMITGISGQDSFYLSSLLLSKGYTVVGLIRRNSTSNLERLQYIVDDPNLILEPGDLTDFSSIERVIKKYQPDELYNLAAQSHVRESFDIPITTANITGMGALYCLEAIRLHKPDTKFYQASSSEMFGNQITEQGITVLNEDSPLVPRSPYGVSKVFAHQMTRNYREAYGLFSCAGILMNHESQLRGEMFVTRKITKAVAQIKLGRIKKAKFGNLDSKRDWGHAADYVKAMYLMLQQTKPDDYVIATGEAHSCKEFLELSAFIADVDNIYSYIEIDESLYRPTEIDVLIGNSSKAKKELNWRPQVNFEQLVDNMTRHDLIYYSDDPNKLEKCRRLLGDELACQQI